MEQKHAKVIGNSLVTRSFVLGTGAPSGETHSVREFVEIAFAAVDLDYAKFVQVDPVFFRPAEKVQLRGNPARIIEQLKWQRTRSFPEIVREMVASEQALYTEAGR